MVAAQVMRQGVEHGVAVLADHRLDGIQLRHPPGGRPGRPRQETLALAGNEVCAAFAMVSSSLLLAGETPGSAGRSSEPGGPGPAMLVIITVTRGGGRGIPPSGGGGGQLQSRRMERRQVSSLPQRALLAHLLIQGHVPYLLARGLAAGLLVTIGVQKGHRILGAS